MVYKEEDTVVPRYELPTLLKGIKEIGKKYGFIRFVMNMLAMEIYM
ncbi:MAG: hypothetical protein R2790_02360 [Flavobacterium haoranii]